tara:strand:+ start:30 stop:647 length:618 start_codon:yes stop_codon:yes gene_type:complete
MAKSKSNLPSQNELKVQGSNLAKLDAKEMKSLKAKTTKVVFNTDSLDYQIGQLVVNILKLENVKVISKELAKKYGINTITKQRRSDAKILFENHEKIVTWLQSTKQRYTSLSALLKAFYKATKPKSDKPKASDETKSQETESKTQNSPKSDTNEPKAQEKKQMTASDLALEVLVQLEMHNISIKDFAREINSQYKELKVPSKKVA